MSPELGSQKQGDLSFRPEWSTQWYRTASVIIVRPCLRETEREQRKREGLATEHRITLGGNTMVAFAFLSYSSVHITLATLPITVATAVFRVRIPTLAISLTITTAAVRLHSLPKLP